MRIRKFAGWSMKVRILTLLILGIALTAGCSKKGDEVLPVVKGSISLDVKVLHHTWEVSGIMVYLERGATEFPGMDSSLYDLRGQADGYGSMTFNNLYPGNYYVYASGYDSQWGDHVFGYMSLVLDSGTVNDNKSSVTLYVSE